MFRLTSLNLNGIRSATNKGLEAWVAAIAPDCMGVQELKAQNFFSMMSRIEMHERMVSFPSSYLS